MNHDQLTLTRDLTTPYTVQTMDHGILLHNAYLILFAIAILLVGYIGIKARIDERSQKHKEQSS